MTDIYLKCSNCEQVSCVKSKYCQYCGTNYYKPSDSLIFATNIERTLAFLIDIAIILLVFWLILLPIINVIVPNGFNAIDYSFAIIFVLISLYFPVLESSKMKATIGKLVLGIAVVDYNGEKLNFSKALDRFLGKFSFSLITTILNFFKAKLIETLNGNPRDINNPNSFFVIKK